MDKELELIYEAWEKATGKSATDNKIRINSDSDWHKDMYGYRPKLSKGKVA